MVAVDIGSWGEGEGSRASVPVLVGDSGKWVRGDIKWRYQGETLRKSAEEAAEEPDYRVCRTTELQKCREQVCLLLLLLLLVDTREEKHHGTCATGVAGVGSRAILPSSSTTCSV